MSLTDLDTELQRAINPVDMIEHVASSNDWAFERSAEDEISITIEGMWSDYGISFSWLEDFEALHLACAYNLKVPQRRMGETMKLLSLVNEQLLIGHFDLWMRDGAVMYRQSLLLNGGAEPTAEQLECLLVSALQACERYYQAFQFVIWAGNTAQGALEGVMLETMGTA